METLIIQYNQSIKEKLMKILNTFSKSELEIVESSEGFEKLKREKSPQSSPQIKTGTRVLCNVTSLV